MSITFQPLGRNLVVALAPETARSAVLHVVKQYADTARQGTVTAIGPEVHRVAVGDAIWLSTLAGTELGIGDGQTLLLPETSVLAILAAE
jgi:co-chaperonin GroES (HSP10)